MTRAERYLALAIVSATSALVCLATMVATLEGVDEHLLDAVCGIGQSILLIPTTITIGALALAVATEREV